ncbi:hypothetical protein ACCS68_14540 [Rhizobium beringeri]|uniref:hypothetical protein n=1 Tax=Rhizobium beringeri TaxID=3019934 RepID=UPI003CFA350B
MQQDFKWLGHDLIGIEGEGEKGDRFKRGWCNVIVKLEDYDISYFTRAHDHKYEDLPHFPLNRSGLDDLQKAQRENLIPERWDGHLIKGTGKIIHQTVCWSNTIVGRQADGDRVHIEFSEVELSIYGSDKHSMGKLSAGKLQFEEPKLSARLYLEPDRLKAFVAEVKSSTKMLPITVDLLASIFYFRSASGEYGGVYLMPYRAVDTADAVLSSLGVGLTGEDA